MIAHVSGEDVIIPRAAGTSPIKSLDANMKSSLPIPAPSTCASKKRLMTVFLRTKHSIFPVASTRPSS